MRVWKVCLAVLLIAALGSLGNGAINLSEEEQSAFNTLMQAQSFSYGGVGVNRLMSEETAAFQTLFSSENALACFARLEAEANTQGKLYALCALYYLDYDNHAARMQHYLADSGEAYCLAGCASYSDSVPSIIRAEEDDGPVRLVRLQGKDDTIEAWQQREGVDTYRVDIYGGGIPAFLTSYVDR